MLPVLKPNPPSIEAFSKYFLLSYEKSTFSNNGPCAQLLEHRLKQFLGLDNKPVLQCNATAALTVVLQAFGLEGTEVILPSFTFAATAHSVLNAGCTPVLADVDNDLYPSLRSIENLITEKTKALIVVQALGYVCDYEKYEEFAKRHNLLLIFDSAAALGARYSDGTRVGGRGDCEVFSLHITKTFGIGEGGLISSRNERFLESCRQITNFGFDDGLAVAPGGNSKCSEIHAAVGLAVLDVIDEKIANKKSVSDLYQNLLEGLPLRVIQRNSAFQVFPVIFDNPDARNKVIETFNECDIGYRIYYLPLHRHPYFVNLKKDVMDVTDHMADRILCLPFFETITSQEVNFVVDAIKKGLQCNF